MEREQIRRFLTYYDTALVKHAMDRAAWLADADAVHDKAAKYYHNVVKH